jgi:putative Mn2+ efflux pump MntP
MVHRLRSLLQYADRIAGVLLVLVGIYLVYYGIHAAGSAASATNNPIGVMQDWSTRATARLEDGGVRLGLVFAAFVAIAASWASRRHRQGEG